MSIHKTRLREAFKENTFNLLDYGTNTTPGTTDMSAALQAVHDAASAASTPGLVVVPIGSYAIGSTVNLKASMIGDGGNGYSSTMARARFIPTITDGTAALRALTKTGIHLSNFNISPVNGSPNPNPSGGNVQNCIGLQMGNCPALMTAATKANPCVITTKYLHTFATGDSITIANVAGMVELNGNTYTVTRISGTTFSIGVDSTGYTTYSSKGLIYPTDLGQAYACTRGVVEDVTVEQCNVNFHLSGWLNRHSGLKSIFGTLGFDGGYLNTGKLDLVTERCWQAVQLLGCNALLVERLEDEGAGINELGAPSTIDYAEGVNVLQYSGEGTRTNGPWFTLGGVSYAQDIYFPKGGSCSAGSGGGVSFALDVCNRFSLPKVAGGYSTTATTTSMRGTATFSASTTKAVSFGISQYDANYKVLLTPLADPVGRLWVTSIATTGFTINNSSSTSISVDWECVRD